MPFKSKTMTVALEQAVAEYKRMHPKADEVDADIVKEFMIERIDQYLADTESKAQLAESKDTISCTFCSIWSDGTVLDSAAVYDPKSGWVGDISPMHDGHDHGSLEEEYIIYRDNGQSVLKTVCKSCHQFVIGPDGVCCDPTCDSQKMVKIAMYRTHLDNVEVPQSVIGEVGELGDLSREQIAAVTKYLDENSLWPNMVESEEIESDVRMSVCQ